MLASASQITQGIISTTMKGPKRLRPADEAAGRGASVRGFYASRSRIRRTRFRPADSSMKVEPSMNIEQPSVPSQPAVRPLPSRLDVLRALAEPMRLALVDELAREGACACDLRRRFDLSAPLLSHHLKVLRDAGLVRCEKVGRRLEVELDREALANLAGSLPAGKRAA